MYVGGKTFAPGPPAGWSLTRSRTAAADPRTAFFRDSNDRGFGPLAMIASPLSSRSGRGWNAARLPIVPENCRDCDSFLGRPTHKSAARILLSKAVGWSLHPAAEQINGVGCQLISSIGE